MSKKNKKSWFEMLCTMDTADTSGRASTGKDDRVRMSSRAAGPYGQDEEIPPFDTTAPEPIGDHIFDEVDGREETNTKKASTAARKTSGTSASSRNTTNSSRRPAGTGRGSSAVNTSKKGSASSRKKQEDKAPPADAAYRAQPYIVLFLGALLAIMLFLALVMSEGTFAFTTETHPFRWVGYHVERILFGLIGYGTFVLPLMMVYLSICRIRGGKSYRSQGRGAYATAIVLLLPTVIHTCMVGAASAEGQLNTLNLKALYTLGADRLGGGVVPGLVGTLAHRGIGVVATLLIGVVGMIGFTMLLLRLSPAKIKYLWCAWTEARQERLDREAYAKEQAKKAQEKQLAASAKPSGKRQAVQEDEDEEDDLVLPARSRASRRERDLAMREAERSDRRERPAPARRRASAQEAEEQDRHYLDPTKALLSQSDGRKKKQQEAVEDPDIVFPDETSTVSEPLEFVSELSREEIDEMERIFAQKNNSVAATLPPEYEAEEVSEPLISYPDRAEIALSDDSPLPVESSDLEQALEETTDYQGGFDYSMSSEEDEGGETVETVGGVEIRVERLSAEERERGEKIAQPEEEPEYQPRPYTYPKVDLLNEPKPHNALKDQEIRAKMQKLNATLTNFKVRVDGISYVCGPAVTRYEVRPAPGVRVRSIANLADDIAMSLAAKSIRIEAPIPGKEAVGIEVPNTTRETVFLRRLIDSDDFRSRPSKLTACLGEDVAGNPILFDIVKMPHLLVAGTTGSGKSVCINDFIMSLVYKSTPQEVKIILIDPKQVEFTVYKDLPHLMAPIVCDPKRAAAVLNLAVLEMEKRFQAIRDVQARNIEGYNAATANDRYEHPYMPHIVIIIDELADLMMQAKDEVENSIVRLAQKARAAGMHLIIGTQRPSVDVITGLIKANVPSRIACTVVSQVDSRTILDMAGAEKLLGKGDMLYAPVGSPKPLRVQGAFVSDAEVERIVEFIKRNNDPVRYDQEFLDNIDREAAMIGTKRQPGAMDDEDDGENPDGMDPKFYEALRIALDNKRISTSLLQRMLSIGYGRAAKIIDQMERMGFVGPAVGNKPREIRITEQGYAELMMNKDQ